MSLERVLFESPWIPYNTTLYQSRLTLVYPHNVIFTVQWLNSVLHSNVYREHPHAEKMDVASLQNVDWTKAIIVFDRDLHVVLAPDPVVHLARLDRRLHYREAADRIFGPFRWSPLSLFRHYGWGLLLLGLAWIASRFLGAWYRKRSLEVGSDQASSLFPRR